MESNKENRYAILVCDCSSTEHQIVISEDTDDNTFYCSIHLSNYLSFWKRLVAGVKYIFGHRCIYGNFDEFTFNNSHAETLKQIAEKLSQKD